MQMRLIVIGINQHMGEAAPCWEKFWREVWEGFVEGINMHS